MTKKKWVRGQPYNCIQCGHLCYQGVLHKCKRALPITASSASKVRLDAASKRFNERMSDGFKSQEVEE